MRIIIKIIVVVGQVLVAYFQSRKPPKEDKPDEKK
jgi:hypothetical protein